MLKVTGLNINNDGEFVASGFDEDTDFPFVVNGELSFGVYGMEIWIADSKGLMEDDLIEAINTKRLSNY